MTTLEVINTTNKISIKYKKVFYEWFYIQFFSFLSFSMRPEWQDSYILLLFLCFFKILYIGQKSPFQSFPKTMCVSIVMVKPSEMRSPSFTSVFAPLLRNCEQKYAVLQVCLWSRHQRQWHLSHTWRQNNPSQLLPPSTLTTSLSPLTNTEEGKAKHRLRNNLDGLVQESGVVFGKQFSQEMKKPSKVSETKLFIY